MKLVKAAELFPIVSEILENEGKAWITVTGMSMYPFLREGQDKVELSKITFKQVKMGDIVLIKRNNGYYVLHRICRIKGDCFFIVGDAQKIIEGPLEPGQLCAKVTAFSRNGKIIYTENVILKLLVALWFLVMPARTFIINLYLKLAWLLKAAHKIQKKEN